MKRLFLILGLAAALPLAADTELDVNGSLQTAKADAKLPDKWIYYPDQAKVKVDLQMLRSDKGNQCEINISQGMLPLFCNKIFRTAPGDQYKLIVTVKGNAKVHPGLYINDVKGIAGTLFSPAVTLKGETEDIVAEFTIPEHCPTRKTTPFGVRFVLNIYKGDLTISKITALKLDGSGVLKKVTPKTPQERLTDAMDSLDGWRTIAGKPKVVNTDNGKAIEINYPSTRISKIYPYELSDAPHLKNMQGITFEAKGEAGRTIWLPVMVGSYGNWSWNYEKYVPVTGDKFQTYTIAWGDFLPPRATCGMEFGKPGALTACGVNQVFFGDNWSIAHGNGRIPAGKVQIRNLRFAEKAEAKIPTEFKGFGKFADVIKKMKSGKEVLIYCSGDSLTASGPAPGTAYGELLAKLLQKKFNNPNIRTKIIAVGGAHSYNLRVWAERDFHNLPAPDLVTLTVGFNDRSAAIDPNVFKHSINDYLNRVSALTNGKTAFLLMPTMPARAERYYMQDPLANAFRELAKERDLPLFDLHNIFKAMKYDEFEAQYRDKCHFNETGHARIANEIADFLSKQ